MKCEDFEKLGISHEIAEKCEEASMAELANFVPKHRFDEVISARDLEKKQREETEKKISELEKGKASAENLRAELEKLRDEHAAERKKHDAETQALKIDIAVERELSASGARSVRVVKANMADFMANAKLREDGTVEGLSDYVSKLKSDKELGFLFAEDKQEPPSGTIRGGYTPAAGTAAGTPTIGNPTIKSALTAIRNNDSSQR